jgi:hypothetical protein
MVACGRRFLKSDLIAAGSTPVEHQLPVKEFANAHRPCLPDALSERDLINALLSRWRIDPDAIRPGGDIKRGMLKLPRSHSKMARILRDHCAIQRDVLTGFIAQRDRAACLNSLHHGGAPSQFR